MASYEEDHNISASSQNTSANPVQSGAQLNPNFTSFFNLDRDEDSTNGRHRTLQSFLEEESETGSEDESYRMRVISALSGLGQTSELAQQLADQLRQETGANTARPPRQVLNGEDILARLSAAVSQFDTEAEGSQGVSQEFLDRLDRVSKKSLKPDDACPICTSKFLDDKYPLVVNLPCNIKHRFDLECVGPWLKLHATCPLCRTDFLKKKEPPAPQEDDEEEDYDDFYS